MENKIIITGFLIIIAVIVLAVLFAWDLLQGIIRIIPVYEKPYLAIPVFIGLAIVGAVMIYKSRK